MMNKTTEKAEVCEACGCAGEMGFIIKEGDDIAEVVIHAEHKKALETELEKYVALAFEVSKEVQTPNTSGYRCRHRRFHSANGQIPIWCEC